MLFLKDEEETSTFNNCESPICNLKLYNFFIENQGYLTKNHIFLYLNVLLNFFKKI